MEMDNGKQLHNATSETLGSHLTTSTDYRSAIARTILKSRLACSLPALDSNEFKVALEAWAEILVDAIPLSRLNDAYLLAMRNKDSNFAVGAPEIVAAWKEIRQAEISRPKPLSANRQIAGDVCGRCHGTGYEVIEEEGYEVSMVCAHG